MVNTLGAPVPQSVSSTLSVAGLGDSVGRGRAENTLMSCLDQVDFVPAFRNPNNSTKHHRIYLGTLHESVIDAYCLLDNSSPRA